MALKKLLMRNKLDAKNKQLASLREKDAEFDKREKELEAAINEMNEETSEEDRTVVEQQTEAFQTEKEEHEKEKTALEEEISGLEEELKAEEERVPEPPKPEERSKERGEGNKMENRTKFFGMNTQERDAFFADERVKNFLGEVRTCMKEKRALTNIGLTIPDNVLPLIRQIAEANSKLMKYVSVSYVSGTTRQNIMGEIPEAYWDEMCASLKELDLAFYSMEMDGYKVSGYFAVCNAVLEDSDVALANELFTAIGKAIAKAVDKGILYGKGVKMITGIVPSLTAATAPDNYPAKGREWENLSASHVITITALEGIEMFQEIVGASGIIDNDYDTGAIVWCMNKKTHTKLMSESMGINSSAAIVAGMNNTMPVIGGNIEEFKYIPDDTIIFGYFKNYQLVERAGNKLGQSEHVRFLEDQTVFRGTARYDGKPAIREAFAVMGLGKAPVTTAPKFAGEE